jgi:cation transporter-like permease
MSLNLPRLDNQIESKVVWSTVSGGITAAVVSLILYALGSLPFIAMMPSAIQTALVTVVTGAVTAGLTFLAGWYAKHTVRLAVDPPAAPVVPPVDPTKPL